MAEVIDHPSHYQAPNDPNGVYEAILVIEAWRLGFNLGNVVKYIARTGKKGDDIEQLEKAAWYLAREIANRKKERDGGK